MAVNAKTVTLETAFAHKILNKRTAVLETKARRDNVKLRKR